MACEDIKARIGALGDESAQLTIEIKNTPASERGGLLHQLTALTIKLNLAQGELRRCLDGLQPQKVPGKQPAEILEIKGFQNPPGFDPGDDWAPRIANGEFPSHQGLEWKQVLDSDDEYDEFNPVGATGWAISPRRAHVDVPFNHPFSLDWEFEYALDPAFNFLLARGNFIPEAAEESVNSFETAKGEELIPKEGGGLLGVEADGGLVPPQFQALTNSLDRIAVFGRWIVDTGHNDADHPFRAEIHPPLLMASASVYKRPDGTVFTRMLVTSRPYLVGQTFGVGTDRLYEDHIDDDGHLVEHLVNEIVKVLAVSSTAVEAHPKIKSSPFRGSQVLELVVRTPQASPNVLTDLYHLEVSFRFTTRGNCAVSVVPNDERSVRVLIALTSTGYPPPALPHRNDLQLSLDDLKALDAKAGFWSKLLTAVTFLLDPPAGIVLSQGVTTDTYDALPTIDLLSRQDAVLNARANDIPGGAGFFHEDSQPYPVYGWIDVGWVLSNATSTSGFQSG